MFHEFFYQRLRSKQMIWLYCTPPFLHTTAYMFSSLLYKVCEWHWEHIVHQRLKPSSRQHPYYNAYFLCIFWTGVLTGRVYMCCLHHTQVGPLNKERTPKLRPWLTHVWHCDGVLTAHYWNQFSFHWFYSVI